MNLREGIDGMLQALEKLQSPSDDKPVHLVTIRGIPYPCTLSTLTRGTFVELGGKMLEVRFTVTVRKSAMPLSAQTGDTEDLTVDSDTQPKSDQDIAPPWAGDRVTVDQIDYRVGSVREDGAGAMWRMDLVSLDVTK